MSLAGSEDIRWTVNRLECGMTGLAGAVYGSPFGGPISDKEACAEIHHNKGTDCES